MTEGLRSTFERIDWRLGRAIVLVAIGAAMHLPLPGQAVAPLLPGTPLHVAALTGRPSPSRLHVERTTIFAPAAAELQREAPPAKPVIPASSLGSTGRDRSAGLMDVRPRELQLSPVPTSGVRTADLSNEPDAARAAPAETASVARADERLDAPLPGVKAVASPAVPGTAHVPGGTTRPAAESAAAPALTAVPSEEDRVRRLLAEYAGAYERLDVGAAQAVYPSVDEKALKKAFAQLASQRVTLQSCGITISGSTANAICRGTATYQPRIGTRPVQIASREWTFDLSKNDTAWKIVHTFVR